MGHPALVRPRLGGGETPDRRVSAALTEIQTNSLSIFEGRNGVGPEDTAVKRVDQPLPSWGLQSRREGTHGWRGAPCLSDSVRGQAG